jgi:hypothetical protein
MISSWQKVEDVVDFPIGFGRSRKWREADSVTPR